MTRPATDDESARDAGDQGAGDRDPGDPEPPTRLRTRLLIGLAVLLVVGALLAPTALSRFGHWLVEADPLRPADAIFVHGGTVPFRAVEAADLYGRGLAPEVWLAPIAATRESEALAELGIDRPQGWHWNRQVLERRGVPPDAIRLLDSPVLNTADELRAVAAELRERGLDAVILVSSKQHTRRIKILWRRVADPGLEAIVRPSGSDPFDPDSWWTNSESGQAVVHEIAGILNVWLGSPLRPER